MAKKNKPPKQHECKVCGSYFIKTYSSTQQVCSVACASKYGRQKAEERLRKKQKADRLQERKRMKAKKENLKSRSKLVSEAQSAVNKYVRYRDNGKPCISCGVPLQVGGIGGGFDAGHFRSCGSAPHLRFYTLNIHGQCKQCNRYKGGNYSEYRIRLIDRIGQDLVDKIESDQRSRHYSDDDLRRIKDIFNRKARILAKSKGV